MTLYAFGVDPKDEAAGKAARVPQEKEAMMDERNDISQNTKTQFPPEQSDAAQSNVQEYLRLLCDREQQLEVQRDKVRRLELKLQDLTSRIDEKEQTIKSLHARVDELQAALDAASALHSAVSASFDTPASISLLPPDNTSDTIPHPATRTYGTRHKSVRIDADVVARLKNDRKAYPVVCDKALTYWQKLADAGLVDHRLKPTSRCGVTVMARIVSRMQTEVDSTISWAFFERYWKSDHLQSNLHRETYKHRSLYAVVNRIFGLPDDAPYLTKSGQTA